jgi:cobalt/nickel transport system permease protein
VVVSHGKYEIEGLLPFTVFPAALIAAGNLPVAYLARKVLVAAPFALFVAIFNPFLDRAPLAHFGAFAVSGGWVSFAAIMIKFILTVAAGLVLVGCTGFNAVCAALARMGVPGSFTLQLLFLYRYIFVLGDEAARMIRARALRSFGGRGMEMRVYGHMLGQLLLRTLDRAQRIHLAMLCRGFDGEIRLLRPLEVRAADLVFLVGWCALFLFFRTHNIPEFIGRAVTGLMP